MRQGLLDAWNSGAIPFLIAVGCVGAAIIRVIFNG